MTVTQKTENEAPGAMQGGSCTHVSHGTNVLSTTGWAGIWKDVLNCENLDPTGAKSGLSGQALRPSLQLVSNNTLLRSHHSMEKGALNKKRTLLDLKNGVASSLAGDVRARKQVQAEMHTPEHWRSA